MTLSSEERKNDSKRKEHEQPKQANVRRRTDPNGSSSPFDSTKSSKSVTFPDTFLAPVAQQDNKQKQGPGQDQEPKGLSVSKTFPTSPLQGMSTPKATHDSYPEDTDLWLAFLTENGLIEVSDTIGPIPSVPHPSGPSTLFRRHTFIENPESIIQQFSYYHFKTRDTTTVSSTLRDDYEGIHILYPGLFHDTITMDDPEEAFRNAKRIIKHIVNSQNGLGPMFDIEFANNLKYYPTVEQRLEDIRREIAPRQIFH